MPRKSGKVPSYCNHKASGRAVVRIGGQDHYLGPYGSPESQDAYQRLIAEWRTRQAQADAKRDDGVQRAGFDLRLSQVLYRYREFAKRYYVKNGKTTKEFTDLKYALRPVRLLYGNTLARDFGPLKLKTVRQNMIDADLSRGVVNNRVNRIKRFFKWAVSEELVPPSVFQGLRAVAGLRYGRTEARETDPVKPARDAWVDAVVECLAPQVAAMVQLQRLTAMRPCEVVIMRACDIDMGRDVWLYEPFDHKNRWRGHRRLIPLGPKAQQVLKPFLTLKTDAFLFSPRKAEDWRSAQRRASRKTPLTPSQADRRRKTNRKRAARERYDVDSYRRAIDYGLKKVNDVRKPDDQIPHWCPLQLRHSRATEIRKDFGIEAAQVSLGHANAEVTQVYAERDLDLAIEIARKTG